MTDPITITLPGWLLFVLVLLFVISAVLEFTKRGLELWEHVLHKRAERLRKRAERLQLPEWGVWLADHGPRKILVIKAIRNETGWSLRESKEASERVGLIVREWPKERAERFADVLRSEGASAEALKPYQMKEETAP